VSESLVISRPDIDLAAERWPGGRPVAVLLHEGIADRRGWRQTAGLLAPGLTVVAYDRRGYGETPASPGPFRHVDDLLAVLDQVADGPAWLVGASAGGGLALDTALTAPDRVAGLVLLGTAVSGAPQPELDADGQRMMRAWEEAEATGDRDQLNRLDMHVWLDGPAQPEGRVSGPARDLALAMNAVIIANDVPEDAGASGVAAWDRLGEVQIPVTVACGDLDVPLLFTRSQELARRLPHARYQTLPGRAHQPYLEDPAEVAGLIREAVTAV
jgi:pimeloyl-ACP methyl ester carboxylesterase